MPLIENTLYGRIDKVKKAIDRIKLFDPSESEGMQDLAPYYVAYSGGKDSDCIRILCELAGVKYDLVHNLTTVDAPETVRYIQNVGAKINRPEISMWRLIEKNGVPTRVQRFCCKHLKERGGRDRVVVTGVRWAESSNRKAKRGSVEVQPSNLKKTLILNADNDEHRAVFEHCQTKGKRIVNPIVDWSDADVWELLHHYNCQSNPLYHCGFHRIGCIGCPMVGKGRVIEFMRWPKYKENYIRAFDRMLVRWQERGRSATTWTSGEAVFDWWMQEKNMEKQIEGQIDMFEET